MLQPAIGNASGGGCQCAIHNRHHRTTVVDISPQLSLTNADSLVFDVEFSETVTDFEDFADLVIHTVSGSVSVSGADFATSDSLHYTVTALTGVSGDGAIRLSILGGAGCRIWQAMICSVS